MKCLLTVSGSLVFGEWYAKPQGDVMNASGRGRQWRLYVLLGLCVCVLGCAGVQQRLRADIQEGRFEEAVERGQSWLKANADDPRQSQRTVAVRRLVGQAALAHASRLDTAEAYKSFRAAHRDELFSALRMQALIREAAAAYRDETLVEESVEAHRRFQSLYPDAPEVEDSRAREVALAFRAAGREGELLAKSEFVERYEGWPEARDYISQARRQILESAFADALGNAGTAPLAIFRARYEGWPESAQYLMHARTEELRRAVAEVRSAKSLKRYRALRFRYGGWAQYDEMRVELRAEELTLAEEEAQRGDTVMGWRAFSARYGAWPEASPLIDRARQREQALAWLDARARRSVSALREFLEAYPYSPDAAEAEALAHALSWGRGAGQADELKTRIASVRQTRSGELELYVQVYDEQDHVVGGLTRAHFSLWLGASPLCITSFKGMEEDRPVDVVFTFDTTGSMEDEFEAVKGAAIDFVEQLTMRNRDARLALVTFGDDVRSVLPEAGSLTPSAAMFREWMSRQSVYGGGDDPENPLDALERALSLRFRKGAQVIFVLITDSYAHERDHITHRTAREVVNHLKRCQVSLFAIAPDIDPYHAMVAELGGTLTDIDERFDFEDAVLKISRMTAKQYKLTLTSPGGGALRGSGALRVRAFREHAWIVEGGAGEHAIDALYASPDVGGSLFAQSASGLLRSDDAGQSWEVVSDERFDDLLMGLGERGDLVLIGRGRSSGALMRSDDEGRSWRSCEGLPSSIAGVSASRLNAGHFVAHDGLQVYETLDAGESWLKLASQPGGRIVAVAIDSHQGRVMATTTRGVASLWDAVNERWESRVVVSPEPGVRVDQLQLLTHPDWLSQTFALSPKGGLWRSLDGGLSWVTLQPGRGVKGDFACGAPELMARVAALHFDASSHWLVTTTDLGVFVSPDDGRTWRMINGLQGGDLRVAVDEERGLLAFDKGGNLHSARGVIDREFIASGVYFASGSAHINSRLHSYLDRLADELRDNFGWRVLVAGHTDDVGGDEMNMTLSQARAMAVRDYLVSRGVDGSRVKTRAYGESSPLLPNTSARNRARNRRVEISIIEEVL